MNLMPGTTFPFIDAPESGVHPLVMLQTNNPPREQPFRAGVFLALHKAVGTANADGSGVVYFGEGEQL
jgi:hypothetical protein